MINTIAIWSYHQPVEFITAQLAKGLADRGDKVAIMDLNLDAPTLPSELAEVFGTKVKANQGLLNIIEKTIEEEALREESITESLVRVTPNVTFFPVGETLTDIDRINDGGYWDLATRWNISNFIGGADFTSPLRTIKGVTLTEAKKIFPEKKFDLEEKDNAIQVYKKGERLTIFTFLEAVKEILSKDAGYLLINSQSGINEQSGLSLNSRGVSALIYTTARPGELIGVNTLLRHLENYTGSRKPIETKIIMPKSLQVDTSQILANDLKNIYSIQAVDISNPNDLLEVIASLK